MNAIEHGNGCDPNLSVDVSAEFRNGVAIVRVADWGAGPGMDDVRTPDLEAKLGGLQTPRGWGLFLIEQMVDSLSHEVVDGRHVLEFRLAMEGEH